MGQTAAAVDSRPGVGADYTLLLLLLLTVLFDERVSDQDAMSDLEFRIVQWAQGCKVCGGYKLQGAQHRGLKSDKVRFVNASA